MTYTLKIQKLMPKCWNAELLFLETVFNVFDFQLDNFCETTVKF